VKLDIQNLSFSYKSTEVLRSVSFSLVGGELVCLLGPNGVGKSTLFKCILSLLRSYSGDIVLDGVSTRSLTERELARSIAYIPQAHGPVFHYSVLDVVLMGAAGNHGFFALPRAEDEQYALAQLEALGMADMADRDYSLLSGGERQLVLIARALAQRAQILVMDEPTANLDYGNQVRVMEHITGLSRRGYGVLLSTHNPEHAFFWSSRTVVLLDGRVEADGKSQDVLTEGTLEKLYGVRVKLFPLGGYADTAYRACVPLGISVPEVAR
jgi:iron complex transport system ATP-binding protein